MDGFSINAFLAKTPQANGESPAEIGETSETERQSLIRARIGQGIFRAEVIAVWQGCSVTGCRIEKLLVASHLVPWKLATNAERLDKFNGLLRTPNLDKLVD
jgi:putative restriction endonuclease